MAKTPKTKTTDEEVLKHYTPAKEPPASSSCPAGPEQNETPVSKPEFIEAVVQVDRKMAKRKSAVIKTKQRNSKTWRKSPTKKH